ncbi:hypothetical protein DM02DRAFT_678651 [Periconia macrospinosa]|uniref:Uncharacterized protein n=1 Tax=Periconia macrospinosa TaxID=97972 RepID=A0A2V1CXA1_9PLEO|nr:hypothetical protein DM02DRAFT_678651 [Periconia macrospinosa]
MAKYTERDVENALRDVENGTSVKQAVQRHGLTSTSYGYQHLKKNTLSNGFSARKPLAMHQPTHKYGPSLAVY